MNQDPIHVYYRLQLTVDVSIFGSEFVALRIEMEQNDALQYKLWMMGVPILGPTDVFFNNKEVVKNMMALESVLKKKALAYLLSFCQRMLGQTCSPNFARTY